MVNIRDNLTLKACRIIAGIKAEDIAAATGVTVDTVYKWERGKTFPTIVQMKNIAKYFSDKGYYVDVNELKFF